MSMKDTMHISRQMFIFVITLICVVFFLFTTINSTCPEYVKSKLNAFPTVYAITPTYARPVQKAELTRLSQTLALAGNVHWIVIEDSTEKTDLVKSLLNESGLQFTHLVAKTPPHFKLTKQDKNWMKPRGVEQRNAGLDWIRQNVTIPNPGAVYFMDDDNTYSIKLFHEMTKIKKVGVWPVGLVGGLMVEKPIINPSNNKVIGFNSVWRPDRPFPIDMAGFGINLELLLRTPDAKFSFEVEGGFQESEILRHLIMLEDMEPLADLCTKVYVWHTRTEKPSLKAELSLNKRGKSSNNGIEV